MTHGLRYHDTRWSFASFPADPWSWGEDGYWDDRFDDFDPHFVYEEEIGWQTEEAWWDRVSTPGGVVFEDDSSYDEDPRDMCTSRDVVEAFNENNPDYLIEVTRATQLNEAGKALHGRRRRDSRRSKTRRMRIATSCGGLNNRTRDALKNNKPWHVYSGNKLRAMTETKNAKNLAWLTTNELRFQMRAAIDSM